MKKRLTKKELEKRASLRQRAKNSALRFRREVQKSTATAIVAAFGFIIALAWRDVITDAIDMVTSVSPIKGKLITAIIITIVSVVGILIVTKALSVPER